MSNYKNFDIEEVGWNDVKKDVHSLNPMLAAFCDQIGKDKNNKLFKIKYPYGSLIVNEGVFCLPMKETLVALDDPSIPQYVKDSLGYCQIPLSIVLTKSVEVFVEEDARVIPLNFLEPGSVFGLFELTNMWANIPSSRALWNVSAGARSIFMLPKITDSSFHRKLAKVFNIKTSPPNRLFDHWKIFVKLHETLNIKEKWYSTILVFTKGWFNNTSVPSISFYNYLFKLAWTQLQLLPKGHIPDRLSIAYNKEINTRNLRPRTHILDTVRHLIFIASGLGLAFRPVIDDIASPYNFLEHVYLNYYSLKDYVPTLMQPNNLKQSDKLYYSLTLPLTHHTPLYNRNVPTIIEDQREIKRLIDIFRSASKEHLDHNDNLRTVNFEFFHVDKDEYGEIKPIKDLQKEDPRFNNQKQKDRTLCASARFFVGCIRITKAITKE